MDYLQNLQKALTNMWRNKTLWVLGFVSLLLSGNSMNFNLNTNRLQSPWPEELRELTEDIYDSWIAAELGTQILLIGMLVCVSIIMYCIFLYIASRAEAGLLSAGEKIDSGGSMGLVESWKFGGKKAFGLVKQRLLINIPYFIMYVVVVIIALFWFLYAWTNRSSGVEAWLQAALVACGCVFVLFLYPLITNVIYTFSSRFAALGSQGMIGSFWQSFILVKGNIVKVFVSWLTSLVVIIPYSIVYGVITFGIAMGLVAILIALLLAGNIVVFIVALVLLIFFGGLLCNLLQAPLAVFMNFYWTIVYKKLTTSSLPNKAA